MPTPAIRIALARMRADRALLSIVGALSLVATTLLTLGPMASSAITDAAVQRRLVDAPPSQGGVEITGQTSAGGIGQVVEQIHAATTIALDVTWLARSGAATYPNHLTTADETGVVTSLVSMAEPLDLLEFVEGRPPGAGEAALHQDAAAELGLRVGDLVVTSLTPDGLRLAGVFVAADRSDVHWWDSPQVRDGVVDGESFTTVGPVVVDSATLAAFSDQRDLAVSWRVLPVAESIGRADLGRLRQLPGVIEASIATHDSVTNRRVTSDLVGLLDGIDRSLSAASVVILALLAMSTALSIPALTIAGGLLVDARRVETALVTSRGASGRQVIGTALAEAALALLLVASLAMPLGIATLQVLDCSGISSDLDLRPSIDAWAVLALAIGTIASALIIVRPLFGRTDYTSARAAISRDNAMPFLRRTRLDLPLIVLAVLGLWRLRHASEARATSSIDPSIVLAPALALSGGALLAQRVVRLVSIAALAVTRRTSQLPAVMVARSIARQPTYVARSTLLIVLAVAIGAFALVYRSTWVTSQVDQANAEVGVDVLAEIDQRSGRVPDRLLVPLVEQVADVEAVRPAVLATARLGGIDADLLLTDMASLPDLLRSGDGGALGGLTSGVPRGLLLEGETLGVHLASETLAAVDDSPIEIGVTVADVDGLVYALPDIPVPSNFHGQVDLPLHESFDGSQEKVPYSGPLRLLGVTVDVPAGFATPDPRDDDISSLVSVEMTDWSLDGDPLAVEFAGGDFVFARRQFVEGPTVESDDIPNGARFVIAAGLSRGQGARTRLSLPLHAEDRVPPLPIVVTTELLDQSGLAVGDRVDVLVGSTHLPAVVMSATEAIPLRPQASLAAMADLGSATSLAFDTGEAALLPTHLLLASRADNADTLVDQLESGRLNSPDAISRWQRAEELRRDPGQVGIIVSLAIALVASIVAAGIGLVANAVSDRRRRLTDTAVLRALGTTQRMLRTMVVMEAVVVLGVAVALGLAIAVLLGWMLLPSLTVNVEGSVAIPAPTLVIPMDQLAILVAVTGIAAVAAPTLVFRSLRRTDLSALLRTGEGRR
ncbi:MAG: FtsX-like permease family protein [Acidimicrobiales bacterium]